MSARSRLLPPHLTVLLAIWAILTAYALVMFAVAAALGGL